MICHDLDASSARSHPRVLIVLGHPVERDSGTAVTIANLFRNWPASSLAQVHFEPLGRTHRFVFGNAFEIPLAWAPLDYLVRKCLRKGGSGSSSAASITGSNPSLSKCSLAQFFHRQARAISDMSPVILKNSIYDWIERFNPDIIYTHLGSIRIMRAVRRIAALSKTRVVVHFMDDWPGSLYRTGPVSSIAHSVMEYELGKCLEGAAARLCISRSMATEYEKRFRYKFDEIMNCVDISWFKVANDTESTEFGVVKFVYAGGMHLGRYKVLHLIALVVAEMKQSGFIVALEIFTPPADLAQYGNLFQGIAGVKMSSLPPENVASALRGGNVLIHVESFEPEQCLYTTYSISTKIPQYLASKRPILAVGPEGLASMQHLGDSGGAVLVTTLERASVRRAMLALLDGGKREQLGDAGQLFARKTHDAVCVCEKFEKILWGSCARNDYKGN